MLKISLEEQKNLHLTLLSDNLEYPFAKISVEKKGWVAGVINDWIADEVRRVNARATSRSQKPSITQTAQDRLNAGSFCEFFMHKCYFRDMFYMGACFYAGLCLLF